jgi:hypothetical protein
VYFTFSYSPIHGDTGNVDGIFCAFYETTSRVIGERRLQTLRDLARTVMEVKSAEEACQAAVKTLAANPYDVPFALMYLLDDKAQKATLRGSIYWIKTFGTPLAIAVANVLNSIGFDKCLKLTAFAVRVR